MEKKRIGMVLLGILITVQGCKHIVSREYVNIGAKIMMPGLYYVLEKDTKQAEQWIEKQVGMLFPLYSYVSMKQGTNVEIEDALTQQLILQQQANDEESWGEDLEQEGDNQLISDNASVEIPIEKLRDFNYLLSKFYTVDSTTTIGSDQLNVDAFLATDMKIDKKSKGPKVLIFHTHSQEDFVDSVAGDASTSIVGVGAYLSKKLNEKGIETMHHDGVYDLIDGELDRSKAYELSEKGVREILNEYPSIEVVIDLHRDGVKEDVRLVTEIDGKQTAKIMFFNGLSRTKTNGDIAYLKNPYQQDNLAFSFQMQLAAQQIYPGFTRKIYLKGYRYSLHMMPKSLLIEAGAQTNTVGELKNAMDVLANILADVLL